MAYINQNQKTPKNKKFNKEHEIENEHKNKHNRLLREAQGSEKDNLHIKTKWIG